MSSYDKTLNKFSPGNISPDLFFGRNQEFIKIIQTLIRFMDGQDSHIHLIAGKCGVGKSTFVKYLVEKILIFPHLSRYIPVYTCLERAMWQPELLYQDILRACESSCQVSPFRKNAIHKVLIHESWLSVIENFAPQSTQAVKDGKVSDFFSTLADRDFSIAEFSQVLSLVNSLLHNSGLYVFWVIDHFESQQKDPEFSEIVSSCLQEVSKYTSRYFVLLSADSNDIVNLISQEPPHSNRFELLKDAAIYPVDNELHTQSICQKIFEQQNALVCINVSPHLQHELILQDIEEQSSTQKQTFKISCYSKNFSAFLQEISNFFISQWNSTGTSQQYPSVDLTKQNKENFYNTLQHLEEIIFRLEQRIQANNLPEIVLFLEYLESFCPREFVPDPMFLHFFLILQRFSQTSQKIKIIPITVIDPQYLPLQKFKVDDILSGSIVYLHPLTREESSLLLQETASISGFILPNELINDVYAKSYGYPIYLHQFGHYILDNFIKSIQEEREDFPMDQILQAYDPDNSNASELMEGRDGRTRCKVSLEIYNKISVTSIDHLYKKLFGKVANTPAQKILEILLQQGGLSISELQEILRANLTDLNTSSFLGFIETLGNLKLIKAISYIDIVHPKIKKYLKSYLNFSENHTTKSDVSQPREEYRATTVIKTKPEATISAPNFLDWQEYVQNELQLLSTIYFPSQDALEKISSQIAVKADEPFFELSYQYISALYQKISATIYYKKDVLNVFIESIKSSQGYSLVEAITRTFLAPSIFSEYQAQHLYLNLSGLYFVRYQLFKKDEDLEAFLTSRMQWLEKFIYEEQAWNLLNDCCLYVENFKDGSKKNHFRDLLFWQKKLLHISHIECTASTIQELFRLSPSRVNKFFHKNLIGYFYFQFVHQHSPIGDLEEAAITLLTQYAPTISKKNDVKNFLLQRLEHRESQIYNLVLFLFPFLKEADQAAVVSLLEARKNFDKAIRVIEAAIALIDENISFPILQKNATRNKNAWASFTRLQSLFSQEKQHLARQFMVESYSKFLSGKTSLEIKTITYDLLSVIEEDPECMENLAKKIISILKNPSRHYNWQDIVINVPTIYACLPDSSKKQITQILGKGSASLKSQETIAVLANISILEKRSGIEQTILKELGAYSRDVKLIAIKSVKQNIHRVTEIHRRNFIEKLLDLANRQESLSMQMTIFDTLAKIAGYFPHEFTSRIGDIFIATLQDLTSDLYWVTDSLLYLLPYLPEDYVQKIQSLCLRLLLYEGVSDRCFTSILNRVSQMTSKVPDENIAKTCRQVLQRMKFSKSVIASGMYFFTQVWDWESVPEYFLEEVEATARRLLTDIDLAENSLALIIKCIANPAEFSHWSYMYQFNSYTWHLAFALYEIFPELEKVPLLAKNYENMRSLEPYTLGLKMANFHLLAGASQRGYQLLDWIATDTNVLTIKSKAIRLKYKWNLRRYESAEAIKNLQTIKNLM